MPSAMSIQKQHPIHPQGKKKGLQQPKTRHQKAKKTRRYFCKRSTYRKFSTCDKNILKSFTCIAITNGLKALFCSFLYALNLLALVYSIEKPYVLAFLQPTIVLTKSAMISILLCFDIIAIWIRMLWHFFMNMSIRNK